MSQARTLWKIAPAVYLPALLYGIGQGAIAPVVALSATHLGASVAVAGLVVAAAGLGQVIGDIPAGALTNRIGERHAMLAATGLVSLALGPVCWCRTSGAWPSRSVVPAWPVRSGGLPARPT